MLSAREFVAWYNGLPGFEELNPDLSGRTLTLLGQGNVAVDVARIVLSGVDQLKKTDITEYALDALSKSNIRKVLLVGRRGPLQAAFTIKELREMIKLPHCATNWRPSDFHRMFHNLCVLVLGCYSFEYVSDVEECLPNLARPRKRITELMLKSLTEQNAQTDSRGCFEPIFFRSPVKINGTDRVQSIDYVVNELKDDRAIPTEETETIATDLVCRSIGYKSISLDSDVNFDDRKGCISNVAGRVLKKTLTGSDQTIDDIEDKHEKGLYTSGWLATGPTGVILTTMNNSFGVADQICKDFHNNVIRVKEAKPGLELAGKHVVSWNGWKAIDAEECRRGADKGKPREKIVKIDEMLSIAGGL